MYVHFRLAKVELFLAIHNPSGIFFEPTTNLFQNLRSLQIVPIFARLFKKAKQIKINTLYNGNYS
jgi:hypothetical protein